MVRDISGNPGNSVVQGGEQDKCAPCGTIRDNSMIWAGLFVVGRLYADSKLGVRVVPGTNGVNLANDRFNNYKEQKGQSWYGSIATLCTNSRLSLAKRKVQQLESTSLFPTMTTVATYVVPSNSFRSMFT